MIYNARKKIISLGIIVIVLIFIIIIILKLTSKQNKNIQLTAPTFSYAEIQTIMHALPKGGELHYHLSGGIYAESYIEWAKEDSLCINASLLIPTIKIPIKKSNCMQSGWIKASNINDIPGLRNKIINSLSYYSYQKKIIFNGGNNFFNTFEYMVHKKERVGDMIATIAKRAQKQNILYLELIASEHETLPATRALSKNISIENNGIEESYKKIISTDIDDKINNIAKQAAQSLQNGIKKKDDLLQCLANNPDPACNIEIRFLQPIDRTASPEIIFIELITAWKITEQFSDLVVGMNLLAPEDHFIALKDYKLQMQMIDFLYNKLGSRNIALHAGELTLDLTRPKELTFHIKDAIELGHAKRIGHGVDITYEEDAELIMQKMKNNNIMLEVLLTSNDHILGVKGKKHPIHLYRARQVPYALSTDDEGVSRINLTNEYVRLFWEHEFPLEELLKSSRNSLTYSFLPGENIWANPSCITIEKSSKVKKILFPINKACKQFLETSKKATLQAKLEAKIQEFKKQYPDFQ